MKPSIKKSFKKYPSNTFTYKKYKWSKNQYKSISQRKYFVPTVPTEPEREYFYDPIKKEWGSRIVKS